MHCVTNCNQCVSVPRHIMSIWIRNYIQTSLHDKCIAISGRYTFYRCPHTVSTYPHTQVCGYLYNVVLQASTYYSHIHTYMSMSTYYIHIPTYTSMWISIQRMPFYILYSDVFISRIECLPFYRYPHTISTCCIDIHILHPHTHIHEYVDIYTTYAVLYFVQRYFFIYNRTLYVL